MSTVEVIAGVTTVWGVAMGLSPVLQIHRIRAAGSSLGVSALQIGILCVGFGLWLVYGLAVDSVPLVVSNVIALAVNAVWLAVAIRHRPPGPPEAVAPELSGHG